MTLKGEGGGWGPRDQQRRTVDLLILVVPVFNTTYVHISLVGENDASGCQPLVTGEDDRIEHALVEQEVAHPFADDNVNLVHRQRHFFDLTLDALDTYRRKAEKGH